MQGMPISYSKQTTILTSIELPILPPNIPESKSLKCKNKICSLEGRIKTAFLNADNVLVALVHFNFLSVVALILISKLSKVMLVHS